MVIKVAAVSANDQEQLNDVLVGIGLRVCSRPAELALQIGGALSVDERIRALLVLLQLELLLPGSGYVLLTEIDHAGIRRTPTCSRWIFW